MSRAVLITSYLDYPLEIPSLLREDDYIICLDGGYDLAIAQGISPALLLGDMDSLHAQIPASPDFEVRRYPPEKDYSDLELALRLLDPACYPDVLIIGGLGGRLDQTVANVMMLARYTQRPGQNPSGHPGTDGPRFRRIDYLDGRNQCFLIQGDERDPATCEPVIHTIPRREGFYLSLFALTDLCQGLTIEGVKYPLRQASLKRGVSLGVSNEFQAPQAHISLRKGSLLVVLSGARSPQG